MSTDIESLPSEILQKICHHVACIYRDALPNKTSYNCFMEIAYKIAIKFAEDAALKQKYAASGMGIRISSVHVNNFHKIVYYSVLSDMTNHEKFYRAFSNVAQSHTTHKYDKMVTKVIISGIAQQL